MAPLRIGLSACLNGERVRYDGDHKFTPELVNVLNSVSELDVFCPEVAVGMSVPRPAIQLIAKGGQTRCESTIAPVIDHTRSLAKLVDAELPRWQNLSGYVFKSRSPSCGIATTRIHRGNEITTDGTGIFASALMARFPTLPVAQECDLEIPEALEHFILRCLIYHYRGRWQLRSRHYDPAVEAIFLEVVRHASGMPRQDLYAGIRTLLMKSSLGTVIDYSALYESLLSRDWEQQTRDTVARCWHFVRHAAETSRGQCSMLKPLQMLLESTVALTGAFLDPREATCLLRSC